MRLLDSAPLIIMYHKCKVGIAGQNRVFSAHLYHDGISRDDNACKRPAVPPSDRAFVSFEFGTDLLPCHVMDIAVAEGVPVDQLESETVQRKKPIGGFYDLAGNFGNCRHEGGVEFRSGKKPEALIEMIIRYFSNKGDWVLDSFCCAFDNRKILIIKCVKE